MKFQKGQIVRLKGEEILPEYRGRTGKIVGIGVHPRSKEAGHHTILLDGDGEEVGCLEHQIELA